MKHRLFTSHIALIASVAILFAGCSLRQPTQATFGEPLPIPTIPDTVDVQVDGDQRFQSIDGLGVNINGTYWNDGKLAPALESLHRDLGATLFRVIIETPYWEVANDDSDPHSFSWGSYDAIYARPEFRSLFGVLRHLQQMPDAQVALGIMGPMPAWMGDGVIDPGAEDEWVEMVSSLLVYARDREGLTIRLISPLNETDVGPPEGPKVGAEQFARLMRLLSLRLDELGLADVRLVVPELTFSSNAEAYLPPLLADELVAGKLAAFAVHDYGGDIADIRGLIAGSPHPDSRLWLTEYSQWCVTCQESEQNTEPWALGADTVSFLLRYLDRGASAALLYDGLDGYYAHHGNFQAWGVLAYNPDTGDFSPRTRFSTGAQVFRFVRPGMVRVAASVSSDGLSLVAFLDPDSRALSIVGRNPTAHPVALNATLGGLSPPPELALYQTTADMNMSPGATVASGERFSVQIAPDSVFALSSLRP
jgi:O-glycosyl hydrolase